MTGQQLKELAAWLKDEDNREAVRLIIAELKYFLKHARFRKISGHVSFGIEDPYTMGRVLSLISIFYPVYARDLTVVPQFDETYIEGEIHIWGHIRLIHLALIIFRILKNKQLRALIFDGGTDGSRKK